MTSHVSKNFDIAVPAWDCPRGVPDTEIPALTDFLLRQAEEILSNEGKLPRCVYCDSARVARYDNAGPKLTSFRCRDCRRYFNRATGTPFLNITRRELLPDFFRLLSQQKSFMRAARELGCEHRMVARWTRNFRAWLLEIDGSGHWAGMVRLGVPMPLDDQYCAHCGQTGHMITHAYDSRSQSRHKRQLRCKLCDGFTLIGETPQQNDVRPRRQNILLLEPEIVKRRNEGESVAAIARALKLCHETVTKVVRRQEAVKRGENPPPLRKPGSPVKLEYPDQIIQEVISRRESGETLYAVAKSLGVRYDALWRQLKRRADSSEAQGENWN